MAKKTKRLINEEATQLSKAAEQQEQIADLRGPQLQPKDDDTRQWIARLFIILYFMLLAVLLVGIPVYNLVAYRVTGGSDTLQIPLSDIVQTYSAVVGPTLGFVVAYYFKSRKGDQ
jgi:hypothetical protein